jgi:hypothetical protein
MSGVLSSTDFGIVPLTSVPGIYNYPASGLISLFTMRKYQLHERDEMHGDDRLLLCDSAKMALASCFID